MSVHYVRINMIVDFPTDDREKIQDSPFRGVGVVLIEAGQSYRPPREEGHSSRLPLLLTSTSHVTYLV